MRTDAIGEEAGRPATGRDVAADKTGKNNREIDTEFSQAIERASAPFPSSRRVASRRAVIGPTIHLEGSCKNRKRGKLINSDVGVCARRRRG